MAPAGAGAAASSATPAAAASPPRAAAAAALESADEGSDISADGTLCGSDVEEEPLFDFDG